MPPTFIKILLLKTKISVPSGPIKTKYLPRPSDKSGTANRPYLPITDYYHYHLAYPFKWLQPSAASIVITKLRTRARSYSVVSAFVLEPAIIREKLEYPVNLTTISGVGAENVVQTRA